MKYTDKQEPIKTIPSGVWESSRPKEEKEKDKNTSTCTTDLQGNGYPANKQDR